MITLYLKEIKNTALITTLTFQKMKIMEMTFIMNMIMIYQKMD